MIMFFNAAIIKNWTSAIRCNEFRCLLCKQHQCIISFTLLNKEFALRICSIYIYNKPQHWANSFIIAYDCTGVLHRELVCLIKYPASLCSLSSCRTGSRDDFVMTQRIESMSHVWAPFDINTINWQFVKKDHLRVNNDLHLGLFLKQT